MTNEINIKAMDIQANAVESSNLKSIGYSVLHEVLEVQFKNGSVYRYPNVPSSTYMDFMDADSPGKYFNAHIRGLDNVKVR